MNQHHQVIISSDGEPYIRSGQAMMFANNVVSVDQNTRTGDLVDIVTTNHQYLATGFYHATSHVAVRILTHDQKEAIDTDFFKKRIQFAYDFRRTVESRNLSNCRLIFGEADGLPGLTIDRYNDVLVSQITSYGMEMHKDLIYDSLLEMIVI